MLSSLLCNLIINHQKKKRQQNYVRHANNNSEEIICGLLCHHRKYFTYHKKCPQRPIWSSSTYFLSMRLWRLLVKVELLVFMLNTSFWRTFYFFWNCDDIQTFCFKKWDIFKLFTFNYFWVSNHDGKRCKVTRLVGFDETFMGTSKTLWPW